MTFLPHYDLDQREEFLAYVGAMDDEFLAYCEASRSPSKTPGQTEGAQQ